MPTAVDRFEVERLIREEQAQLVEVLPTAEFNEEHLEGAIHLPLKNLSVDRATVLDRRRPVIVYCWDGL